MSKVVFSSPNPARSMLSAAFYTKELRPRAAKCTAVVHPTHVNLSIKNKFHDDILLTGASLKTGAVERADMEARGSGSGRAASRLSCPRGSFSMK